MRTVILVLVASATLINCADIYFFNEKLAEGSPCTTNSGYKGTCTKSHYCPREFRTNSASDICFVNTGVQVICCKNRMRDSGIEFLAELTQDEDLKGLFNDIDIIKVSKAKRLSEQKFDEYMDNIFKEDSMNLKFLNGRELTSPGKYPHMSAIGITINDEEVEWKCGGSLISEKFVLTAAHCADFSGQKPNIVRIGDLDLRINEATVQPQTFGIKRIIVYPKYRRYSYYHDIALVQLSWKAIFTVFVRPACLWSKRDIPYNNVVAMGYGSTEFARAQTNQLTELNLTVIDNSKCNEELTYTLKARRGIISSQICARDSNGNRDTCQGDSGGPLQLNILKNGRMEYFLVGITSYGIACGSRYPSVYTRIHSYLDWIEGIVWT